MFCLGEIKYTNNSSSNNSSSIVPVLVARLMLNQNELDLHFYPQAVQMQRKFLKLINRQAEEHKRLFPSVVDAETASKTTGAVHTDASGSGKPMSGSDHGTGTQTQDQSCMNTGTSAVNANSKKPADDDLEMA